MVLKIFLSTQNFRKGLIMGFYFNPPEMVCNVGRKLNGQTFQELNNQLKDNEILIGIYDRGMFKNAPHLFSEKEFIAFEEQNLKFLGYYAIIPTNFSTNMPSWYGKKNH